MAYMSQENKKEKALKLKSVFKRYRLKATLSIDNYSTLVVNISEGKIDFISNANETAKKNNRRYWGSNEIASYNGVIQVNPYHYKRSFSGIARRCLTEIMRIAMEGNHNNSDTQRDYCDVGWYVDINIGRWNKPYRLIV